MRTKDLVFYQLSNIQYYIINYCHCEVAQSCLNLCEPVDSSQPGSSIHGILQQEYWSGLPFPSPGDLPNPGIEPRSHALQAEALTSEPPGKPIINYSHHDIQHIHELIFIMNGSFYLLTTFIHFTHHPNPTSGNQQSVLCICGFFF